MTLDKKRFSSSKKTSLRSRKVLKRRRVFRHHQIGPDACGVLRVTHFPLQNVFFVLTTSIPADSAAAPFTIHKCASTFVSTKMLSSYKR